MSLAFVPNTQRKEEERAVKSKPSFIREVRVRRLLGHCATFVLKIRGFFREATAKYVS